MKNKKYVDLKLRTKKLGVFIVIMLMLTVGISGVLADITFEYGTDGSGNGYFGPSSGVISVPSIGRVWECNVSDFQLAIWSLNSTGGTVLVGDNISGTSAISLVNNTILDFQGHTMNLTGSAGFHMFQLGDGTTGVTDVEIKNGIFEGNRTNQAGSYHCIYAQDKCQRINIHDNYFTGWYGKAVTFNGGALGGECEYITVRNNIFDDFEQGIDSDGVEYNYVYRGVISGNLIEETGDDAIDLGASDAINIIGNTIRDCCTGIEVGLSKSTVVGNSISKIDTFGIVLDSCVSTVVNGNYLFAIEKHGIRMLYARQCSIIGNTIWRSSSGANNTYDSIHLQSDAGNPCTYNTIIGNTIREDHASNRPKYGINEVDSDQDYNIIFGNTINGTVSSAINKSGVHSIIGYNIGYETVFPTVNISTAQVGYAYTSGNGLMIYTSGGWFNLTVDTDTTLTEEEVEDYAGGMFTGNTETRCTVTYQDGDGTIDVVVDDLDTDTTYSSGTGINLTATTFSFNGTWGNAQYLNHALFGSNGLIKRTGASTYSIVTDNSTNWDTAYGWGDHSGEGYIKATLTDEQVQDKIGAMVTGNTETGITVEYQDGDGTLDFVVSGAGGGVGLNVTNITNSNGNEWLPTGANIQLAIDDAGDYGWVSMPAGTISVSSTIWNNYTGLELYGHENSSKLFLANNANCTMFSHDGGNQLYYHDFMMDGNAENQPVYSAGTYSVRHEMMRFTGCENVTVENCYFYNVQHTALITSPVNTDDPSKNIKILNCDFYKIGKEWEGQGYYNWYACGLVFHYTYDVFVDNCRFDDIFSDGLVFETGGNEGIGCVVSNCIFIDCFGGLWFEESENCMVTNCYAYDINNIEAYPHSEVDPCGFYAKGNNITFSNCQAHRCGNLSSTFGSGLYVSGEIVNINNCLVTDSKGIGIVAGASDSAITGCTIEGCYKGIYITDPNTIVNSNIITNSISHGITVDYAIYSIVSNNIIDTTTSSGSDGIYFTNGMGQPTNITVSYNKIYDPYDDGICPNTGWSTAIADCIFIGNTITLADRGIDLTGGANNIILFNKFISCTTEITKTATDRVNCSGYDDWNFYTGVS